MTADTDDLEAMLRTRPEKDAHSKPAALYLRQKCPAWPKLRYQSEYTSKSVEKAKIQVTCNYSGSGRICGWSQTSAKLLSRQIWRHLEVMQSGDAKNTLSKSRYTMLVKESSIKRLSYARCVGQTDVESERARYVRLALSVNETVNRRFEVSRTSRVCL